MNEISSFEVTARSGHKGVWKVSLDAEAMTLTAADGDESLQILRADAEERIELRESRTAEQVLVVSIPGDWKKKAVFKVKLTRAALLKEWLGPPTLHGLKAVLRRRYRLWLAIGILFVVASIVRFDGEVWIRAVSAFLGVVLIGLSILTRVRPRRILLLLAGIWYVLWALGLFVDILRGGSNPSNPLWVILVIALILAAKRVFSEYQRFAPVSPQ